MQDSRAGVGDVGARTYEMKESRAMLLCMLDSSPKPSTFHLERNLLDQQNFQLIHILQLLTTGIVLMHLVQSHQSHNSMYDVEYVFAIFLV